ncbi:MAG: isoprenylcysteine carboxylmethyltransferase family protein [Endomicrobiaceae bacterium]|nr:isoprenylcysteine carboxylmethyltransferase family protein [Endomicrobiaceae bacterium]
MTKSLKNKLFNNWTAAIIILPVNVLIVIPIILLYLTDFTFNSPSILQIVFSLITGIIGAFFAGWSMLTFKSKGNGTPAPWAPPQNFVGTGPYQYVRNPMISGVIFLSYADFCIPICIVLFLWFLDFNFIILFYIHYVEEPQLKKRFGKPYEEYLEKVPGWIPKF